jgi:Flp pilus assembly protein TadB
VTVWSLSCGLSLVAAVLTWQSGAAGRAVAALPGFASQSRTARPDRAGPRSGLSAATRRLAVGCSVVAVLLLVPTPLGWLLAAAAAGALNAWLVRQPGRAQLAAEARVRRQLPLALELMAAALTSGATTSVAVSLAARGCGPPISRPLNEVAASLGLGAAPDEAWRPVQRHAALQPVGRLAVRSTASGAAMAGACRELAGHEREAGVVEAQVAIKRAGVLTVLPLALCFLPSFVLVGVVPIVVGLLRSLAL